LGSFRTIHIGSAYQEEVHEARGISAGSSKTTV
jgi:hypothetical protein